MPVERHVVDAEGALPALGALSDRIDRFAFIDPHRGRSEGWTARLGGGVVSNVRSSGHVISVEPWSGATLLAPICGAVSVDTGRSRFRAGAAGAVFVDAGARVTTVEGVGGRPAVGIGFAIPQPPEMGAVGGRQIARVDEHGAARALVGFGRHVMEQAQWDASDFPTRASRPPRRR